MFAKQSQNLTTKKRRRQGRHRANRPSPPLPQNQSGTTRLHRNRNPRRRNPRRFRAKRRRRGNPNRRETRKHQGRKKRHHLLRKSVLPCPSAQLQRPRLSGSPRRRLRPNKKARVLQAASVLRLSSKNLAWKRTRVSSLRHRLRRKEVSGPGLAVRVTIVI